jgi:hypothetical protein
MTTAVVPAVVPSPPADCRAHAEAGSRRLSRRPLPLPPLRLAAVGEPSVVYGTAAIDCNGRLAERAVLGALGWLPGTRLSIRESGGLVVVTGDRSGVFGVTGQGHLRLPATVRHRVGLTTGDRVLLSADSVRGVLVVHPPAALEAMIAQVHASLFPADVLPAVVLGGDQR